MASSKTYLKKEIKNILKDNGFIYVGKNGGRSKYKRDNAIIVINDECNKIIFQKFIKEYSLIV